MCELHLTALMKKFHFDKFIKVPELDFVLKKFSLANLIFSKSIAEKNINSFEKTQKY